MNSKTNIGLVEYCKAQLGKPYWYGTFGQLSDPSLLANKRKQYPAYYKASDFGRQMGVKVHDCIGVDLGLRRLFVTTDGVAFRDKKYIEKRRSLRFNKKVS